jgi:hydroxymethylpyrimidine pyrophosphatase-like HAD family hydrolase
MAHPPTNLISTTFLGLILICVSTFAVAGTESSTVIVTNDKSWIETIPSNSGEISFSTTLKQNDILQIIFSKHNKNNQGFELFRIDSTDHNCNGEHETSLKYKESKKNYLAKYFDKKTPWNNTINYSIKWKNKKEFTVTVNESTYSIQIAQNPKYIRINTDSNITLTNFLIR